jgi:hypothetical protein
VSGLNRHTPCSEGSSRESWHPRSMECLGVYPGATAIQDGSDVSQGLGRPCGTRARGAESLDGEHARTRSDRTAWVAGAARLADFALGGREPLARQLAGALLRVTFRRALRNSLQTTGLEPGRQDQEDVRKVRRSKLWLTCPVPGDWKRPGPGPRRFLPVRPAGPVLAAPGVLRGLLPAKHPGFCAGDVTSGPSSCPAATGWICPPQWPCHGTVSANRIS